MPLPGQVPYYMTGPATRPGAVKSKPKPVRKGNKIRIPGGAVVTVNPKKKGKFGPISVGGVKPAPKNKPRVVATGPKTGTVTRPKATGGVTGPQPTVPKNKGGKKPPTGKGGTVVDKGAGTINKAPKTTPKTSNAGIGFDPKTMAQTVTNLGYDADIAEIQRQIDLNRGNMNEALADLNAWANQIEDQHRTDSALTNQAWDTALQQAQESDANIAALFGGAAGGEAAAYSGAGEDYLSALGASDEAFNQRMYGILGAQEADYERRARAGFNQQLYELQGNKQDLLKEKGQAYSKNLLDLMDMAWGRKQDVIQNQIAQEALKQSKAMAGLDVQAKKQEIQAGNVSLKAQKLALKKSRIELNKLLAGGEGNVDWADPATRSQIGNAAFSGALSPRNTFMVNPRMALENAQIALSQMGLSGDPRAQQAIWNAFIQILNFSHAHKQWGQYRIKNGQLIIDPTKKFRKK